MSMLNYSSFANGANAIDADVIDVFFLIEVTGSVRRT